MKFIFVLFVIALGSANILRGAQTDIRVGNDKIVIRVPGQIVIIDKPRDDKLGVQVFVKQQDRLTRKIKIDRDCHIVKEVFIFVGDELPENLFEREHNKETMTSSDKHTDRHEGSECGNTQGGKTQMDGLVTIFKKHEGFIEEDIFRDLLKDVKLAVHNNECHPVFIEVLEGLEGHFHTPVQHFWNLHISQPITSLFGLKNMAHGETKGHEALMFGAEKDNQLNKAEKDQIAWIQELMKDDKEQLTDDSLGYTKNTDCSKNAMSKQLVIQNTIRELQGQIFHHQVRAQKLQLQQQHFSQQKNHIKLQIMTGHQRGMPFTQLQVLNRLRAGLQNKEQDILETQMSLHLLIQKLQQELTMQEEKLQQCLEDERRADEKLIETM